MEKRIKDTGLTRLDSAKLVKIGELAKMFSVLPSTINFYTREGLLKEAGRSQGGYRLYNPAKAMKVLKKIADLQTKKRYTIEEIKSLL
jgi:MerR family transcriptional regulator, Zn(II)-responsive regulator of zntA